MNKLLYSMILRYRIALFFVFFLSGCAGYQPGQLEKATSGFNLLSQHEEVAFGVEFSRQFESSNRIITDWNWQNYVNTIGQRLVRASRRPNLSYRFKVVDTDVINACAFPGGFIYVNRGLISAAANEDEVAGIIAHEIGHVAAKHGARAMSRQLLINLGLLTLEDLTEEDKDQQIYLMVAQIFAQGFSMKYSRDDERQADDLAVETLYYAGYDPVAWIDFLARMEQGNSSSFNLLRSTHPNTSERVRNVYSTFNTHFSR